MDNEFGDFEEVKEQPKPGENPEQEAHTRVRLPRRMEILGIVTQRLGGNRMEVKCSDGKTRNCRVPGKYKKKFWLRAQDFVLVMPWEFDNSKADVVYQYRKNDAAQLKKQGYLDKLKDEF